MRAASEGHRQELLTGLRRFVASARQIAGVRRIAVLGSIVTAKPDPKDIDVLVLVADDANLALLATCSRRLQGHAQRVNCGADVFLADELGSYIGRTCHWKDCRPGVRLSCDALHCGRRPYLHDDLGAIRLNSTWFCLHRSRCGQKLNVVVSCHRTSKKFLPHSNTPSNIACTRRRFVDF